MGGHVWDGRMHKWECALDWCNSCWKYCNQHICKFRWLQPQRDSQNKQDHVLSDQSAETGAASKISKTLSLLVFSGTPWRTINTLKHQQTANSVIVFLNFCLKIDLEIWLQVQQSFTLTLTHEGPLQGVLGGTKTKFSANNAGCWSVPQVVHDGAPLAISKNLHTALTQSWAGLQSNRLDKATMTKTSANTQSAVWVSNATLSLRLTTTGYGAWGLPEEMRANCGPGTHLTTACRPFLQGIGLLGIDSWAWHSDREVSLPRQWTFSTQNPFFFAMRLSLCKKRKVLENTSLKSSFLSSQTSEVSEFQDWVMKYFPTLLRDLQPWYPIFSCGKNRGRKEKQRRFYQIYLCISWVLQRKLIVLWGHQSCANPEIHCPVRYFWAGHTQRPATT